METINFLLISGNEKISLRCQEISRDANYSFCQISDSRAINKLADFIILTTESYKTEEDEYKKHPSMSLVAILSRKMKVPESISQILLKTHERIDMTGFPYKPNPDTIPLESMLIQFSELSVDERINGSDPKPAIVKLDKLEHSNIFSVFFLVELQKHLTLT